MTREPTMPRILVIEDDEVTAREIVTELAAHGMAADWAATGCAGLECALAGGYDLITLDRMLPGISGIEVITADAHDVHVSGHPAQDELR